MVGLLFDDPSTRFFTSPAPWTPLTLGSVVKAWWSADDHGTANMTDDGSGLISNWIDRIANFALTGTTTARPTWASNSFNSAYAGVTFNGTATNLRAASTTGLITGTSESWIFVLTDCTVADATTRTAFSYGNVAANAERALNKNPNANGHLIITDSTVNLTDLNSNIFGVNLLAGNWVSATEGGYFNGVATNPATAVDAFSTSTTRTTMGANCSGTAGAFWTGVIRHVLVTGTLTATQRQQLEGWLAWDVGLSSLLPSSHPYKLVRP